MATRKKPSKGTRGKKPTTPRRPVAKPPRRKGPIRPPALDEAGRAALRLKVKVKADRKKAYASFLSQYRKAQRPRAGALGAPGEVGPLTLLAEGDSWFEYPLDEGGVISHLEELCGEKVTVANLAHHGDEARMMLGVAQRRTLQEHLRQAAKDCVNFDALLFSGGGNDIAGDQFCLWLEDYQPGFSVQDCVNLGRLDLMLGLLHEAWKDVLAICAQLSPSTVVFFNLYDFAVPTGVGVCFQGPWLKPSLDYRGIPAALQPQVVRFILERFRGAVSGLDAGTSCVVVQTQGVLDPAAHWANEIHPTSEGFGLIAAKFRQALAVRFPGRL